MSARTEASWEPYSQHSTCHNGGAEPCDLRPGTAGRLGDCAVIFQGVVLGHKDAKEQCLGMDGKQPRVEELVEVTE